MKAGLVRKGQVAGQYFEYTGLVKDSAVIQFKTYWKAGHDIEPAWPFEGRPSTSSRSKETPRFVSA
jgi:hypothetical protein